MHRTFRVVALSLAAGALWSPLHAQAGSRPFAQVTIGSGSSCGGDYEERGDFTIEALLAGRLRPRSASTLAGGIAVGTTFDTGSNLTCRIKLDGGCVPIMPRFRYGAVLAGVDRQGRLGTLGLMGGPAGFGSGGTYRVGGALRADIVSRSPLHVALLDPRVLIIPNVERSTLVLRSLSVGARVR